MKTVLSVLVILILASSFVLAQGQQGIHEPGTGLINRSGGESDNENIPLIMPVMQQAKVRQGNYVGANGQQIQIQEEANNRLRIRVQNVSAHTDAVMLQEQVQNRTRLMLNLSNGRNAEIKVMPNVASETALQRLRLRVCSSENNCTIELKEAGLGNQTRAMYQVNAQREAKVLGLFRARMNVQAQIDAETGEVISSKMPWWSFLATE